MVTKSARRMGLHPSKGMVKSVLHPSKRTVRGVLKHNSARKLQRGGRNIQAIISELGKYGSRRVSSKRTNKLIFGLSKRSKATR